MEKKERAMRLLKACLLAALPLLCCMLYCGKRGISAVYLPLSEWNDELFYYKQVEGIVHFGYPQGYFGFNESHALRLSFAAWSPVLVFPWIVTGLLFGWHLLTPVYCNIVLLTVAVFLFAWWTRPTWKQAGCCALLFVLYRPFVRYMLSGMPEVICFSLSIVFYGLAYWELQQESRAKRVGLFGLSGLMTLMRPYFLLFLGLPIYLEIRKDKKKGTICSLAVLSLVLGLYAVIKQQFGAAYFAPLFFTDWLTTFFREGFGAGLHNFCATLFYMGRAFWEHTIAGFSDGLASGAFFGGYLVVLAVLLVQSAIDLFKSKKKDAQLVVQLHLTVCFVGMLFALLLMYKLTEGSKHLLTFLAVAIFVVSKMETRYFKKIVLIGVTFAYLYTYKATSAYDYQVPFGDTQAVEQVKAWEAAFDQQLSLVRQDVPNYENVVIWVFNDQIEGGYANTRWQLLYALPKGFGISCCMPDYCMAHWDALKSRYLAVVPGGQIDRQCKQSGYKELIRDDSLVLYERQGN